MKCIWSNIAIECVCSDGNRGFDPPGDNWTRPELVPSPIIDAGFKGSRESNLLPPLFEVEKCRSIPAPRGAPPVESKGASSTTKTAQGAVLSQ